MSNEHPRAVAARLAAEQVRAVRDVEKAQISHAKRKHNVKFLTVGNYTVCYRVDRRDVIELSTAMKHPNDRNDRHTGQALALRRFAAANRIRLKNSYGTTPEAFLETVFSLL